jgi:hypothetical protein
MYRASRSFDMATKGHESNEAPLLDPEQLWRSALHDVNNAFGGLLGILELNPDPAKPLAPRDRQRLEAVAREGLALVVLARALALDRLPESELTDGEAWRSALNVRLASLSTLHRCPVILSYRGDAADDRWPGGLLQQWVASVSKQLFPLVAPGPLGLVLEADARQWRVRWVPSPGLPQSLQPGTDRPRDLAAHFALALAERMGIRLSTEGEGLLAVIPRT